MHLRVSALLWMTVAIWMGTTAEADLVLTSEFFTGRIQAFDATTKAESNFATVAGNPGFSGLAFSQATNTVYASALNHGGIYRFNAQTGSLLGFSLLGIGPGGLAVSQAGNVYVTDFTSSSVRIYDSNFSNLLGTITTPAGPTSGVGFLNNGDALIATAGGGVFRSDGNSVTSYSANPLASA